MGGPSCIVVRRAPCAVRRAPLTFVRQRSSGHSFWPIFIKLAQDLHLDSPQVKFETGSDRVKNQVTRAIYRKTALALQQPQILLNLHRTCSRCSSGHYAGQVRNWVRSGQKLGHKVYLQKNGVSTLVATDIGQSSPNLLRMFIWTFLRPSWKLG